MKCCYWITIKTGQIIGDENKSDIIIQFFGTLRNSRKARIRAELTSFYSGKLDLFSIKGFFSENFKYSNICFLHYIRFSLNRLGCG